jgi:uncharacterized protein (DUF2267 family)
VTVPSEYARATVDFYQFLADARDAAGLTTTNQAHTMVQGVLQAFRHRLEVSESIRFLGALPVGLRALFVADWDIHEHKPPFEDYAVMTKEVQSLRPLHNYAPDTAIYDVPIALRHNVDKAALDRILVTLPQGAMEFWHL